MLKAILATIMFFCISASYAIEYSGIWSVEDPLIPGKYFIYFRCETSNKELCKPQEGRFICENTKLPSCPSPLPTKYDGTCYDGWVLSNGQCIQS